MPRDVETTLFRPNKNQEPEPSINTKKFDDEEEEPSINFLERVQEAVRSMRRRKFLSFVVLTVCGILTTLAVIFAPRSYQVEARVLVQKTQNNGQQQYVSADEMRNQANEYQEQILSREAIVEIVKSRHLVERWDEMRQPHRRLQDKINATLGKPALSDEAKFDALVASISSRLKVWIDATTISIDLDWSEPVSAKDIVEAATNHFLQVRNQVEVGVLPEDIRIQEAAVKEAHKELEAAANELVFFQKAIDPKRPVNVFVPSIKNKNNEEVIIDPVVKAKLDNVRGQIQILQEAKLRRVAELNQELIQKRQVYADGHPEVQALRQTIAATEQDPPQLLSLRHQERELNNELASKAVPRIDDNGVAPRLVSVVVPKEAVKETVIRAKSVQDAQVMFDAATRKYGDASSKLEQASMDMKRAEMSFRSRYKITLPAEVPIAPRRPVGLIAAVLGMLATIFVVFGIAALADRLSGIFYEPRDVRDRLKIAVFATFD